MSTSLGDARFPELAGDAGGTRLLIVPLGSTEQHGPHLPLSTDTVIAEAWANALAGALESEAVDPVVAPALPYGAAGEHQSFPGTLSIGTDVTLTVVVELMRSAAHSFDHVVFLSGHAGNIEALQGAINQLRYEGHRVDVVLPTLPGSDAHAGRTETSLMLHIAPELVDMARAEKGATAPIQELLPDLRAGGVAAVSTNGVLGDPTEASAAEGAEHLRQLVEHAAHSITI